MSEPDDTPTRLLRLLAFIQEHQHGGCHILSKGDACTCPLCDLAELRADVSRLREALKQSKLDSAYHSDCRPNRREAEAIREDAKAVNDRWADEVAEVSRLREQHTAFLTALRWTPESDYTPQDALADLWRYADVGKQAEADVTCLQQENALLERSLDMLTKPMGQAMQEMRTLLGGLLCVELTDELKHYHFAFTRADIERLREWLQVYTPPAEVFLCPPSLEPNSD